MKFTDETDKIYSILLKHNGKVDNVVDYGNNTYMVCLRYPVGAINYTTYQIFLAPFKIVYLEE